jgi:hypothetical protein
LVGLDVADGDGDGRNELVYTTDKKVSYARLSGGVLEELSSFDIPTTLTAISIDFYDINGDGRYEIVVSCQQDGAGASSFVLAYSTGEKTLNVLGSFIPWYLRVYGSGGNRILAVQKSAANSKLAFTGEVYQATFRDGKIVTGAKVDLPFGVNLFNFNYGDLGSSHQNIVATVTFPQEHLRLYSGTSRDTFVAQASAEYCGTVNHVKVIGSKESGRQVVYLPSRIIFADIDNDGANEVIVAKNRQSGVSYMSNLRAFDGGLIEAMKFNNLSLVSFFSSTNLLPGPPVDYQLADLDNNGTKDLVAAVVIDPGSGMSSTGRSVIVSYSNLYAPPPQPPQNTSASK